MFFSYLAKALKLNSQLSCVQVYRTKCNFHAILKNLLHVQNFEQVVGVDFIRESKMYTTRLEGKITKRTQCILMMFRKFSINEQSNK